MEYILKHKNIDVLSFNCENGYISSINEIYNESHVPIPMLNKNVKQLVSLNDFWRSRTIPASRQNLQEALEIFGNITPEFLAVKSFGLSLSDHYWVVPSKINLNWNDVNFFTNSFSEDVGNVFFGYFETRDSSDLNLISPDNTSDGWLKKKWIIEKDRRFLIKSGSNLQQEPFNEVLASEICKRLGINHVEYNIVKTDNNFYSSCPDFISPNSELVPAAAIIYSFPKDNNTSFFNHLINCCTGLGLQNVETAKKDICDMLVVDYIIANTDRHFNNFGFIRNPDTLEWKGLAPIYDSGTSMFNNMALFDIKTSDAKDSRKIQAKPFAANQCDQLKRIPYLQYSTNMDFKKLEGIADFYSKLLEVNPRIEEERKMLLGNILSDRIKETEQLVQSPQIKHSSRTHDNGWER